MTLEGVIPAIITLIVNVGTVAYFVGAMRAELRDTKGKYVSLESKIDDILSARVTDAKDGGGLVVRLEDFAATKRKTETNHDDIIRLDGRVKAVEERQESALRRFEEVFRGMSALAKQSENGARL